MKKTMYAVLLGTAFALTTVAWISPSPANADEKEKDIHRIEESGTVLQEVLDMPDGIRPDLMDKARCIIVFPSVVKAAFVVGGSFGHGVMECRTGRDFSGSWGAPAMMSLEQGSVGFQIGGQATDFVSLVMDSRGADSLLQNKVKLGADASVAAGPKGRDAAADTDAAFRAEMLTYSRARGVFAGISLEGGTIHADNDADHRIYGNDISAEQIVKESKVEAPAAAHTLIARLTKASPALHA